MSMMQDYEILRRQIGTKKYKALEQYINNFGKIKEWEKGIKEIRSIEDVTNPLLNSINEKCSRIRAAFLSEVDSTLLEQYIVTGKSGEEKKITVPRDLVVWEE